jgi:hypothetical protein
VSAVPADARERDNPPSPEEVVRRYRTLIEQLPLVVYVDALDEVSSNIFTSLHVDHWNASVATSPVSEGASVAKHRFMLQVADRPARTGPSGLSGAAITHKREAGWRARGFVFAGRPNARRRSSWDVCHGRHGRLPPPNQREKSCRSVG